ncbi:MAG: helix-turn-helix transcriptional regulator [Lachnospiraceae bacterium]|nr:helix-turn-helix transcriptional regulator [Lachnospiraceae bacterium]
MLESEPLRISLSAARVNAGMTQDDVARTMHISKQTVVNWEKGKVIPTFAVLTTLSGIYNIPIDNIFIPEKST